VRERVASGALQVRFISSSDQLADVFTIPATRQMLDRFSTNLNLVQSRSSDKRLTHFKHDLYLFLFVSVWVWTAILLAFGSYLFGSDLPQRPDAFVHNFLKYNVIDIMPKKENL
jgi:hypothetical protein